MRLFGPPCVFVMILHTCASHLCGNVTSAGWQVTLCDPIWHVWQPCKLLYICYLLTFRSVEGWKSVSAGVLEQSVGDDRVAGGFIDVLDIARRHVLITARPRCAAIFST